MGFYALYIFDAFSIYKNGVSGPAYNRGIRINILDLIIQSLKIGI